MNIERKRELTALVIALLLITGPMVGAQSGDPFVGTWNLNVKRSQFKGNSYTRSRITIVAIGDQRKTIVDSELDTGTKIRYEFTAAYDGKNYPILNMPTADAVSLRRVDANTIERTHKSGGTVDSVFVSRISPDGKTMTVSQKGTTPRGVPVDNVLIFERQ